jgi:hypothetical protein
MGGNCIWCGDLGSVSELRWTYGRATQAFCRVEKVKGVDRVDYWLEEHPVSWPASRGADNYSPTRQMRVEFRIGA